MSLTKNLYRFDEVRAAFLYCLAQKRANEALFWLDELEDSCYSGEARRLLLISWMMCVGLRRLSWLAGWSKQSQTRVGRQLLCWQLTRCNERDSSIWWLLWSLILENNNTSTTCQILNAWRIGLQKDDESFWSDLLETSENPDIDTILEMLQNDMRAYSIFAKAIGISVVYSYKRLPKSIWLELPTEINPAIVASISEWRSLSHNIRKRRVYIIPYDCLFGMTRRGLGEDTTDELHQMTIHSLLKSASWKKTVEQYVQEDDSDTGLENFWDTHFNFIECDHPDEWSLKEQRASHGEGATGGTDAPLSRWWRNWITQERLFIYGRPETIVSAWVAKEKIGTHASVLDRLLGLYKDYKPTGDTCIQKHKLKKEFICT